MHSSYLGPSLQKGVEYKPDSYAMNGSIVRSYRENPGDGCERWERLFQLEHWVDNFNIVDTTKKERV